MQMLRLKPNITVDYYLQKFDISNKSYQQNMLIWLKLL